MKIWYKVGLMTVTLQMGSIMASYAASTVDVDDDSISQSSAAAEAPQAWSADDEAEHQALANTVTLIANALALAHSSNARPDLNEETVRNLLSKREQKLAKLNELSDNVAALTKLRTTVTDLVHKNNNAFEAATRNQAFQQDELAKMVAEVRRLRHENVILLEVDEDEFQHQNAAASSHSSQQSFNDPDLASVASSESMLLEEALVRDHREVAKALQPNQESKQKIIDGFKAHLRSLGNTHNWLAQKLDAAMRDLDDAKAEFEAAEKSLEDIENAALTLEENHPGSLSPVVVDAIRRRQADAAARKKEGQPAKWTCEIQ